MTVRNSPSDQPEQVIDTAVVDAPASATNDATKDTPVSGDAKSSSEVSSASDDQGAKKDQPKPTLADVIKTAAKADESGKSPDPANKDQSKAEGQDAAKAEVHDPKDDEKLPFHNHPRWKEVIGQNRELSAKVQNLEPAATEMGKINNFMQEHQLSHEEVGEGFIIMAMIKAGDPRGLLKLDEYRDKLATALGEKIPADIQAQIDSGAISEEAGKELSKTRAGKARSDAEATRMREAETTRTREVAAANTAREFQAGVTAWQTEAAKTDPDFAKKESAIARYSRAIMQERGFPKTRDEAVQIVKDAYAEVNMDFAAALPAKKPVSRVDSAPSSHGAKTKPGSLLEAVRQAANS